MTAPRRSAQLQRFADEVGESDPVTVVGGATNRAACAGARPVRAPAGIDRIDPAEMIVACGGGTRLDELEAALAEVGQRVQLPRPAPGSAAGSPATVGGALATGRADERLVGLGPVRDALLQMHYVSAEGRVVMAGGPTVKNVSGFDLCRLFVGAEGTLGFIGEVLMRTRPMPRFAQWFETTASTRAEVARRVAALYRPTSVVWDGTVLRILLEGHHADVAEQATRAGLEVAAAQCTLPTDGLLRHCGAPPGVGSGPFVEWWGTGVVFSEATPTAATGTDGRLARLHEEIKHRFDPAGRLNPGRVPGVGRR